MKNIIKALCILLVVGCSAEGPAYEGLDAGTANEFDLGQVTTALTRPDGYGMQGPNFDRCTSNTGCYIPSMKNFRRRFMASTCDSWWQARFVEADNDLLFVNRDLGWNIQGPTSSGGANMIYACGTPSGTNVASFAPSATQGTSPIKYSNGTILVDPARVIRLFANTWNTATEAQRQRYARNIILHEMMHMVGLGHAASPLMYAATPTWFSKLVYPNTDEINMLDNYIP